jgi:hypothetical protein
MTIHGLSGKEGRKWLRHRLRRWYERNLTPSEQSDDNRSHSGKEKKMGLVASKTMSPEPSEVMDPESSKMADQASE